MKEAFLNRMKEQLKDDYPKLLACYQEEPSKALRINISQISVAEFLEKQLFPLTPIPYLESGFEHQEEKIGNSIFHQAGFFYSQEPSAMIPISSISFDPSWKVLDLCAAPGGKTTAIASFLTEGFVVANEVNYPRAKKLLSNVERMGLNNVIVTSASSEELKKVYQGYFDVVLLDAPCSGEGMFRKEKEARTLWSEDHVKELALLQQTLLEDASGMLKQNGILIYSTCTFSEEENEGNIHQFLEHHNYQVEEVRKEVQAWTYPGCQGLSKTRRCYPFLIGEGQYVAVLRKKEASRFQCASTTLRELTKTEQELIAPFLTLFEGNYQVYVNHDNFVVLPFSTPIPQTTILACFVKLGSIEHQRFVPHHQFFKAYGKNCKNQLNLTRDDQRVKAYLRGEEIFCDAFEGYGTVLLEGVPVGFGKVSQNRLKNHYPKGLRTLF